MKHMLPHQLTTASWVLMVSLSAGSSWLVVVNSSTGAPVVVFLLASSASAFVESTMSGCVVTSSTAAIVRFVLSSTGSFVVVKFSTGSCVVVKSSTAAVVVVATSSTAAVVVGRASMVAATRRKVATRSALEEGMPVLENMLKQQLQTGTLTEVSNLQVFDCLQSLEGFQVWKVFKFGRFPSVSCQQKLSGSLKRAPYIATDLDIFCAQQNNNKITITE